MSEYPHYDVAVIGYGPTGVTAANLLGADGLNVAVIEREPSIYSRARAISTDEEVLRIWQQVGLAERLKQDMLGEREIQFVDDRGKPFIKADLPSRNHGHPSQMFIYQPALEEVLREGVERYPSVELKLEHECLRVVQRDDHVELMLVDLQRDEISRITASYVIAADGGSSPARGQLGIGFEGRTYEDRWVVIDTAMRNPWDGHDRLKFHCDPRRPAVDCPTPLGHHRWEFPVLDGEDENELTSEREVWRLLNRQGITSEQVEILRAVVYKHHVRFASQWRVGRIFLAGDAAHVMPPWIGQGMSAGVRDAANLCWKITGVLRGELPAKVLDSYETERQPHVRAVTRRAVLAGRVITERRKAVGKARDLVFRAIEFLPPLRRAMQDHSWIPHCRYREGFFVGKGAAGRKIPQPAVLDEHGDQRLLDDITGGRWTTLGEGGILLLPPGSAPQPGAVVDVHGVLTRWMRRHDATALLLRPDGVVYAAATTHQTLPTPPHKVDLEVPAS